MSRCRQVGTVVFPLLKPAQTDPGTQWPILRGDSMGFLPAMLALCLSAPLFAGGVAPPQQGHAEILGTLLYTDISVDWQEVSARDAMGDLEALLGTAPQVYWERDNRPGMERELPITLRMENQPMLRVLDRLLDECSDSEECGWQLRDGLLEIGLKSHLGRRSAQELEVYPILDLLFVVRSFDNAPEMGTQNGAGGGSGGASGGGGSGGEGGFGGGGVTFGGPGEEPERVTNEERAEEIIEIITSLIEPTQWEVHGGNASIRYFRESLLVRAPNFVHRQIGGLDVVPVRPKGRPERTVSFEGGKTIIR